MNKYIYDFSIYFNPKFWIMKHKYNKEYDDFIIKAMKENKNIKIDYKFNFNYSSLFLYININELEIYIGDYPYDYGTIEGKRPSRRTIKELKDYILKERKKHLNEKNIQLKEENNKLKKENNKLKKENNNLNKKLKVLTKKEAFELDLNEAYSLI